MEERIITLQPGHGNALAIPHVGRFRAGKPKKARISAALEAQLRRTPGIWKITDPEPPPPEPPAPRREAGGASSPAAATRPKKKKE